MKFGMWNWIVVVVYLLGMVAIGYWFMKREASSSTEAYFRGGQKIPFWVAGLSIFATMLSAITFMAVPGVAYAKDWNGYIGQWPILIIVPLVVMFYLPFYRRLNITTAYEYLEKRFNVATRVIGSVTFMLFHIGRVAIVLYLPALALSSVTDINVFAAIAVIGILCVIYTVMGGIEAVVWTDAIQALVLIGGALLCFGLIVSQVDGGLGAIGSAMSEEGKGITASWSFHDISIGKESTSGFVLFVAFMLANLPSYTSGQDVVQRYVTTSSEKEAAKSLWMNIVMVLVGSAIFFGLGTALFVFYQENPELMDPTLPTKDSVVILGVVGIGISCVLAEMGTDGVFMLFNRFIGFALGPLGGLFALGIFSRRPNGLAGLVALLSGVLTVTVTYFLNEAGVINLMPLLYGAVGFLTTLGTGLVLGFWLRASDEDVRGLTIWTQKK